MGKPVLTDVEWLLKHIEGLERLLIAYKLGTQPTERTWNMLEASRPEWLRIKNGGN